jgi:alcohol dehydrogenase class IV
MNFEFSIPTKIIFGVDSFKSLPKHISELGRKPLIITDDSKRYLEEMANNLISRNITFEYFTVTGEPKIEDIREGTRLAKKFDCDVVVSIGGGSIIDSGKAIAVFITNTGDVLEYLEVIGKGKPITDPPVPIIAVPTTAGTGSEVTSNAVLSSPKDKVKVSARSPLMFPLMAIIDPLLTKSLPPLVTACSGLDALIQLIEVYLSNKSNPFTDALCNEGIKRAARSLKRAYLNGDDIEARQDMSLAAMFSGIALSNAKLGAIHGIAGPLGGMIDIPHGAACAKLFYPVFETNLNAFKNREPNSPVLNRFVEVSEILSGRNKQNEKVDIDNCAIIVKDFLSVFEIPALGNFGLTKDMIPDLAEKSKNSSSMKGNPILLNEQEMQEIIEKAF